MHYGVCTTVAPPRRWCHEGAALRAVQTAALRGGVLDAVVCGPSECGSSCWLTNAIHSEFGTLTMGYEIVLQNSIAGGSSGLEKCLFIFFKKKMIRNKAMHHLSDTQIEYLLFFFFWIKGI
jgi:hypothetical protein